MAAGASAVARRPWRRWLGGGLAVAALGFVAITAVRHGHEVASYRWRFRLLPLAASLGLHVVVLLGGVALWKMLLRLPPWEQRPAYPRLLRAWAWGSVARYVPGAVWQFLAAGLWARDAGLTLPRTAQSLLVHSALSLFGACTVAAVAAPAQWGTVRTAALSGAVLLGGGALLWARRHAARMVALLLAHAISWAVYGVAFGWLASAALGAPLTLLPALAAAHGLAFAAGLLAVVVPGGLGVREAALWALLATWWPASVSAAFSLLARLWSLAAELTVWAIAVVWGRIDMHNA